MIACIGVVISLGVWYGVLLFNTGASHSHFLLLEMPLVTEVQLHWADFTAGVEGFTAAQFKVDRFVIHFSPVLCDGVGNTAGRLTWGACTSKLSIDSITASAGFLWRSCVVAQAFDCLVSAGVQLLVALHKPLVLWDSSWVVVTLVGPVLVPGLQYVFGAILCADTLDGVVKLVGIENFICLAQHDLEVFNFNTDCHVELSVGKALDVLPLHCFL